MINIFRRRTIMARSVAAALVLLALNGCVLGPNYTKPSIDIPDTFKEAQGWKSAEPSDDKPRGNWWEVFGDPALNTLVAQVDVSNQNVQLALAQYRQAQAAAQAARASFFPTIGASASADRSDAKSKISNSFGLGLDASWEPDLWGGVARSVEAGKASSQSNAALLAAARLSEQASLVQDYFQLRITDETIVLQANTVEDYRRALQITQNQFAAGIVTRSDIAQAQSQLKNAEAQLIDLGVGRAQLEHAIAILIGKAPAAFNLDKAPLQASLPDIPLSMPSKLLERRPDIAAAERRAAAANAQIGVARAAYFPNFSLSASGGFQNTTASDLFNVPSRVWSLGASLAQTIFDGGLRAAHTKEAVAAYDASVAEYRQTVLGGLQEVEDNLVALRLLADEAKVQDDALAAAREAQRLALDQYKAGTANYTNVIVAQTSANSAARSALQLLGRRYTASALMIKALGGGWQGAE
ncbi:MAG: transporter [Rhodocyclales bacterium]|nr:transporter [Rhodocyclales bacterium]